MRIQPAAYAEPGTVQSLQESRGGSESCLSEPPQVSGRFMLECPECPEPVGEGSLGAGVDVAGAERDACQSFAS